MLVVGCAVLKVGNDHRHEGYPIPEAAEWPQYIKQMYFKDGRIIDVSEAEAARLYKEAMLRNARDKVALNRRLIKPAEMKIKGLDGMISEAKANLQHHESQRGEAQRRLELAQAGLLEAEIELQGLDAAPLPEPKRLPAGDTEKTDESLQAVEKEQADQLREWANALSLPRLRARLREHLSINMPRLTKAAAVEFIIQQIDDRILGGEAAAAAAMVASLVPEDENAEPRFPEGVSDGRSIRDPEEDDESDEDEEDGPEVDDNF